MATPVLKPVVALTPDEEDQLVNMRLAMEDRQQVRRVIKRWQMHIGSDMPHPESSEHFLLELETFRLAYRKSDIIIRAEEQRVIEYQESKARLEDEVLQVLQEIEQLKVTLEESQELRRQKIAYDEIADKINELPSRAEQESQISTLLAEVAAIKEEQEAESRIREERQGGLAELNRVLDQLRIVGKGAEAVVQDSDALIPEMENEDIDMAITQPTITVDGDGEMEEGEEREGEQVSSATQSTNQSRHSLNPYAAEFQPRRTPSSMLRSRLYGSSTPGSPAPGSPAPTPKIEEDVEMEEGQTLETKPTPSSHNVADELEEGETHSSSSPLTSVEDD